MSHILAIDDDPFMLAAFEAAIIAAGHTLASATTGAAGVAAALAQPPDLVLLDIELPDRDGYAVCRELRDHESLAASTVIFVSGHGGPAARLAAYDAGGDDFVVKPFAAEELRCKVRLAMKLRGEREALRGQAGEATRMALTALSDSGALGVILKFFRASFRIHTPHELATALLQALAEYGLDAVVHLRVAGQTLTLNSQGRSSAMEGVLLAGLADAGERVVTMGCRLMVGYPHVTVLVKNMPLEDEARCGSLRDHLAMLVEGAEERALALATEMLLSELIEQARTDIEAIDAGQRRQQSQTMAAMNGMMQALERMLPHLGLTMAQENGLIDLAETAMRALDAISDAAPAQDGAFAGLRHLLGRGRGEATVAMR